MPSLTRSPALALALALSLALGPALLPGLAPSVQAQEQAQGGPDNGSQDDRGQASANDSPRERQNRSEPGNERGGPPDDGAGGPPGDRGRGPPVEIRETPAGFATRAPPEVARPEVAVDARNASANVQRSDVEPLDVHIDHVVEFVDEDGDGAYDLGEPVENRTALREAPSRIEKGNQTRTVVYELGNGSELRLRFDLTARGERVGAKFDVVVDGYEFGHEDARIALGSRLQVPGGLERAHVDGREAVVGEQGEDVAYLSWVSNVTVDGAEHPVASSVHVEAGEGDDAIVYWAYPQGEHIVHDPELGVTDAIRDLAGSLAPFALGLAATATVLFGGYAARARWNR